MPLALCPILTDNYKFLNRAVLDRIVVLLLGGDKSTQTEDIEKAKNYWKDYFNHEKV